MNHNVYELLLQYQNKKSDQSFMKLLSSLSLMIKGATSKIDFFDREDVFQDISIAILNVCRKKKFEIEGFKTIEELYSFYVKDEVANSIKKQYFLKSFLKAHEENMLLLENTLNKTILLNDFNEIYKSYVGNLQVIHYFQKVCKSVVLKYYRRLNQQLERNGIRLNELDNYGEEKINYVINKDAPITFSQSIQDYHFSKEEKKFIKGFFCENGQILTQVEYAKLCHVSQQAISKKIKTLKIKARKFNR